MQRMEQLKHKCFVLIVLQSTSSENLVKFSQIYGCLRKYSSRSYCYHWTQIHICYKHKHKRLLLNRKDLQCKFNITQAHGRQQIIPNLEEYAHLSVPPLTQESPTTPTTAMQKLSTTTTPSLVARSLTYSPTKDASTRQQHMRPHNPALQTEHVHTASTTSAYKKELIGTKATTSSLESPPKKLKTYASQDRDPKYHKD